MCERSEKKAPSPDAHVHAVARSTLYAWLTTRKVGFGLALENGRVGGLEKGVETEVSAVCAVVSGGYLTLLW